jgi:hypothetical protein|tara:strand:+ start:122 stop:310 length:189 start_codon:yes stop_codon:yes gene_type:complete
MSVNEATARNMSDSELKRADPCIEVLREIYNRFEGCPHCEDAEDAGSYKAGYQAAIDEIASL